MVQVYEPSGKHEYAQVVGEGGGGVVCMHGAGQEAVRKQSRRFVLPPSRCHDERSSIHISIYLFIHQGFHLYVHPYTSIFSSINIFIYMFIHSSDPLCSSPVRPSVRPSDQHLFILGGTLEDCGGLVALCLSALWTGSVL